MFFANMKALNVNEEDGIKDGEKISLPNLKEHGTTDIYPIALRHNPNGHLFAVNSDSEFYIYRS